MRKRVVITGVGPITPIGIGRENYWSALMAGRSGAKRISFDGLDMSRYASQIGCPVEDFSLPEIIARTKDLKYLGRTSQFALAGARLALEDAGFKLAFVEKGRGEGDYVVEGQAPDKVGVIMGSGVENMDLCEKYHAKLIEYNGPKKISPFALPHIQIGSVPANVSKKYGLTGTTFDVSSACASASHAVITAYRQLIVGEESVIVTGGADNCMTPYTFGGFVALNAMSTRNEEPQKASRPFDRDRDGFVIGEGAGIIVLEELSHALRRGAHIYCEVTGGGATSDAYHIAAPEPSGEIQARALRDAMKSGGAAPEEIDYINAHGTSTPLNDPTETRAIKQALGSHARNVLISSTKSMTGHLIGASGGIELIATALMIEREMVHPTINLENPDESCDLNYVPGKAVRKTIRKALKNSFGFGGQNACILLEKYEA